MNVAKVAISLPRRTLESLDRASRKAKISRSAAVARAIEVWLADAAAPDEREQRYIEGYREHPETPDETAAVASGLGDGWGPWHDGPPDDAPPRAMRRGRGTR